MNETRLHSIERDLDNYLFTNYVSLILSGSIIKTSKLSIILC